MFEIIKFVLGLGIIAGVVYVIVLFYLIESNHKRRTKKIDDINNNVDVTKTPVKKVNDFYGTDFMREHPEKFLQTIEQKRRHMARGEDVGVNAAQAFAIIRTSKHNGLIMREDGILNMRVLEGANSIIDEEQIIEDRHWIMTHQIDGSSEKENPNGLVPPDYVEKVENLKDGAVRWVYKKWYADECGVVTLFRDRHGRIMPDPDAPKDDGKGNGHGGKNNDSQRVNDAMTDISKKHSLLLEMEEEARVDVMLASSGIEPKKTASKKSDRSLTQPVEKTVAQKNVEKEARLASVLIPTKYIDEVQQLEKEHVIPDFFALFEEENQGATTELVLEQEEEVEDEKLFYEGFEDFISFLNERKNSLEVVLSAVLSADAVGFVFADFQSREVLIEKNYFARSVRGLFRTEDFRKFDEDFLSPNAMVIYNYDKVNSIVQAIDPSKTIFLTFGKGRSRSAFNLMIRTDTKPERFVNGWFLKIPFTAHQSIGIFVKSYEQEIAAEIIGRMPKEISRRSKLVKKVDRFY